MNPNANDNDSGDAQHGCDPKLVAVARAVREEFARAKREAALEAGRRDRDWRGPIETDD